MEGSLNGKIDENGASLTKYRDLFNVKPSAENYTYLYFSTNKDIKPAGEVSTTLSDQYTAQFRKIKFTYSTDLRSGNTEIKLGYTTKDARFVFKRELKAKVSFTFANKSL